MTFEERIERLTKRHEALGHYVELLAHESDKRDKHIARLATVAEQALDSINALARIVESHERRIHDLEGGQG
jgi:hypothetical protein